MNPFNVGLAVFSFGVALVCIKKEYWACAIINFAAAGLNATFATM